MEDFKNLIKQKENGGRKGFDSKSKTWKPHKSAEGGTDTIGWGHKLTAAEQAGGYVIIGEEKVPFAQLTEDKNNILFEQDWARKSQDAAKFINEKGDWNSLTEPQKLVSTELFYNLGNKATQYKNFRDKILTPNSNFIEEIDRSYTDTKGKKRSLTERTDPIKAWYKEQGKAPGVNSYEQYMQAAENENAALMPTYGAPKVAAAPAVSPNFKVAGGYNPNKAPENVMSQYGKGPREVITETETITEDIPLLQRAKTGLTSLGSYFKNFEKGGPVNLEEYMQAVENSNKDLIPNFYANENITPPRDGTYTLLPEEIITPYQDDTIMEEEIITQPPQYSMQEAARRSMMLGNEEQRMADYENAQYNPQQNSSYALPQMQAAQRMMGGYAQGGTVNQAQGLASLGRGGDSTLVHMQPQEVAGLQQLAQANGTSLTRNPMTGYPEAFSLKGALKAAAPIAAGYFLGPAAATMMGSTAAAGTAAAASAAASGSIAAGAVTGAGIAAVSGDDPIMGAVSGGLGGMSGGNLAPTAGFGAPTQLATSIPQTASTTIGNPALTSGVTSATGNIAGSAGNPALTTSGGMGVNPGAGNVSNLDLKTVNATMPGNVATKGYADPYGKVGSFDEFKATRGTLGRGPMQTGTVEGKALMDMGIEAKPLTTMQAAGRLGAPVASMGLGGLEESDFINKPDFDDPRDKYNPYSKLNLSNDTGISEAMSRDTGLRLLAKGGYLQGPGDGMSDDIPATINGDEPAALADGEFVVPADVVSHLGNGSSEAGSKQLYAMMARIRNARTGRKSQGKEIKPGKYMPR